MSLMKYRVVQRIRDDARMCWQIALGWQGITVRLASAMHCPNSDYGAQLWRVEIAKMHPTVTKSCVV